MAPALRRRPPCLVHAADPPSSWRVVDSQMPTPRTPAGWFPSMKGKLREGTPLPGRQLLEPERLLHRLNRVEVDEFLWPKHGGSSDLID